MNADQMAQTRKTIEADYMTWMTVHGALSLALRHPQFRGPSRAWVVRFVKGLGRHLVEAGVLTQEELESHYALEGEETGMDDMAEA